MAFTPFSIAAAPTRMTATTSEVVADTDVAPVIGTTTGPLITGTPAGQREFAADLQQVHPDIDLGHPDVGDLGLPALDFDHDEIDPEASVEVEDVGLPAVAEVKKFPTLLVVGGGVAALALLWLVMRK